MPRALILYRVKEGFSKEDIVKTLSKGYIGNLLGNLHKYYLESKEKAKARVVKIWMNSVRNERVVYGEAKYPGNLAELSLEYEYMLKYPSSLGSIRKISTVSISVIHFLWVRKRSPIIVFMDIVKRSLSKLLMEALSYAIYGRPDVIQPLSLRFEDFESLEAWIKGEGLETTSKGFIRRAVFGDTVIEESHLDEVSVKRTPLETQPIFKNVKEGSRRWISLTFVTPLIEEIGTRISCRITNNGSIMIYTPLHELSTLDIFLSKLESILALTR